MRLRPAIASVARDGEAPSHPELLAAENLSALDREIIRFLQHDGRCAVADIARELNVATKAVSRRISELRAGRVIDITAVTDPKALGFQAAALLGVRLDRTVPAQQVVDALWELPQVDYLSLTSGRYGMIAEVVCRNASELLEIVERRIAPVPGVVDIELYPYLSLYYQRFRFSPAQDQPRSDNGVVEGALAFNEMDQRIIAELNRDGRIPFQDIGDKLDVSESQVRRRVRRMVDSGGLRIMAMSNPISLGFTALAWLAIKVAPGASIREVARKLSATPAVIYIVVASGRFDLFVDLVARDDADLLRVLDEDVRTVPGVGAVEAWLHLDLHWRPLRPLLDE